MVINVLEQDEMAARWKEALGWSLPVLLDRDGSVSESYAPEGILPDLPRNQIPIAANLIIDDKGIIRFYTLLDSRNFDAKLIELTARLDQLLAERGR